MTLRLVYFARLREAFGTAGEEVALPDGVADVAGLVDWLRARGGDWARELAPGRAYRIAVDHEMAAPDAPLAGAREVAIFPPVTGG